MRYAGDINSSEAFSILKNEKNSYLIDVRTQPEWQFSGIAELSSIGKDVIPLSWMFYPRMDVNPAFAEQVGKVIPDKTAKLFFICKVGGRSIDAAMHMTSFGYENCYNITGGFEGELNTDHQRGKISGWKAQNLPWMQA